MKIHPAMMSIHQIVDPGRRRGVGLSTSAQRIMAFSGGVVVVSNGSSRCRTGRRTRTAMRETSVQLWGHRPMTVQIPIRAVAP